MLSPVFKVEIKSKVGKLKLSNNSVFRNKSQHSQLSRTFREASSQAFETPNKTIERLRNTPSEASLKHHFMTAYQTIKHRRMAPRTDRAVGRAPSWDKNLKLRSQESPKASIHLERDFPKLGSLTHKAFEDFRCLNIRKSRLELWTQAELERKKAEAEYIGSSGSPKRQGSIKLTKGRLRCQLPSIWMRDST